MGGAKSRSKGARGERQAAEVFQRNGYPDTHRSAPMQAGQVERGYCDLAGTGLLRVEVKSWGRVPIARLAAEMLREECPGYEAVLASKDDRGPWLGTMDLARLSSCMAELERLRAIEARLKVVNPELHQALTSAGEVVPVATNLGAAS